MKKRLVILAALLIAAFCFNAQPASAASSGKCGANATWKLSGDTLTISGTGAMDNYTVEGGELENGTMPWAADMLKIKKVVIGEGITHLGEFAFFKATNLKSVSLPSTLVEIGAHGFQYDEKLESVQLPKKLQYIGSYAFNSSGVKEFRLGASVTGLGAFWSSHNTTAVYVETLKQWLDMELGPRDPYLQECAVPFGEDCFLYIGGKKLTNVVIPEGYASIGPYRFLGVTTLKSVTIPDSVTDIGDKAFYGCTGLTQVEIPDSVVWMGEAVFRDCTNLKTVEFSSQMQSVPKQCFYGCVNLERVNLADWVSAVLSSGFEGCEKLTYINEGNDITNITFIEDSAFFGCKSLLQGKLELSPRLYYLGEYAFFRCDGITEVHIPGGALEEVGYYAFSQCSSLRVAVVGEGVKILHSCVFSECPALEQAVLPSTLTELGVRMFSDCPNLKKLTILADAPAFPESTVDEHGQPMHHLGDPGITTVYCNPGSATRAYAKSLGHATANVEKNCLTGYHKNEEQVVVAKSCTQTGVSNIVCTECGKSEEVVTQAEGHQLKNGKCAVCGVGLIAAGTVDPGNAPQWFWHILADGTLEIFANEPTGVGDVPWAQYANRITKLVVGQNVLDVFVFKSGQVLEYPALHTLEFGKDAYNFSAVCMLMPNLKTIIIHEENDKLELRDGALYHHFAYAQSDARYKLILCPPALSVTDFVLPADVETIGANAFAYCDSLRTVTVPKGLFVGMSNTAFARCPGLEKVIFHVNSLEVALSAGDHQFFGDPAKVTVAGPADSYIQSLAQSNGYNFQVLSACALRGSHSQNTYLQNAVQPDCTKTGYTGDTVCDECGEILARGEELPLDDHAAQHIAQVDPTCTDPGAPEYWRCSVCDKQFADEACQFELSALVPLPALGHEWGEPVNTDGVAHYTCLHCTATKQVKLPSVSVELEQSGLEDAVLTDEEKELISQGQQADVYIEVEDITETVTPEDKSLIQRVLENCQVGMYLDIDLFKQIGESRPDQVTDIRAPVIIAIEIPEELRNADAASMRNYWIIRIHEGIAERLAGHFDPNSGVFTFETDRFSTYALVYEDVPIQPGGDNTPPADDPVEPGVDYTPYIYAAVAVVLIAAAVAVVLVLKTRKKQR